MVKETNYRDGEIAEKCQNWCEKYKSYNLKFVKHAIKL